jgi:D-alanine--poly(phosphoribitol) ligase subunit 1
MTQISTDNAATIAQLLYSHASDRPAIVINGKSYSYSELINQVREVAAYLKANRIERIGILASRSLEAYVGILAAHWVGIAYIPLNPAFPVLRLKKIIEGGQINLLMMDEASLELLKDSDAEFISTIPILAPFHSNTDVARHFQLIRRDKLNELVQLKDEPTIPDPTNLAYIIFTSGTTGEPKGVMITFGNLKHFIQVVKKRYSLKTDDRISQHSALNFDVSVFDMCLAFMAGATLYVVPENILMAPANFITDNQLTVWLSVPAVISIMHKLNMLKPDRFPSLKYSLFTGDTLTLQHAEQWLISAPNSQLENLYGPTEVTIDCLGYKVGSDFRTTCEHDLIPLGKAFSGMYAALIDEENKFLQRGEKGVLAIAGPQLALGYWQNEKLTQEKFIELDHPDWGLKKWYLTGDYCLLDQDGIFHYIYRTDTQCKINGRRIELEEIEYHVRHLTKFDDVVALVIPTETLDSQIIVVVDEEGFDFAMLKDELKRHLPSYMIPARIIYIDELLYSSIGKINRQAIAELVIRKVLTDQGKI